MDIKFNQDLINSEFLYNGERYKVIDRVGNGYNFMTAINLNSNIKKDFSVSEIRSYIDKMKEEEQFRLYQEKKSKEIEESKIGFNNILLNRLNDILKSSDNSNSMVSVNLTKNELEYIYKWMIVATKHDQIF